MNGILLINHFLHGEKYDALHRRLVNAADDAGIELTIKTNLDLACRADINADFVLFWDKDVNLARRLERGGTPVFNCADAIEKCDDKARTYIELDGVVPQPETLIAPKTYFPADMTAFAETAAKALGLPLVFKECFGSFGAQVYLCGSVEEILRHTSEKPFILQKFVDESAGTDYRLEIIGGKCVSAAKRTNTGDFRSNVTNGGKMEPCDPTEKQIETAIKACETLGLTFAGVDILTDGSVCEVNSNAHIINIAEATGRDVAPLIFDEIKARLETADKSSRAQGAKI